jgi:sulfate adenylyltransferase
LTSFYPLRWCVHGIFWRQALRLGVLLGTVHATARKNFGCTHFIVGRGHVGVGDYDAPYAAQEIFNDFPDLGIIPLFFTAFVYCRRCVSVANDKVCPQGDDARVQCSGTLLRHLLTERQATDDLILPEVADIFLNQDNPVVEVNYS